MRNIVTSLTCLSCLLFVAAGSAFAQAPPPGPHGPPFGPPFGPPPRHIDVVGEADVRVVPDQVTVRFGVESTNEGVEPATKDNDARIKKVMGVVNAFKVEAKNVQTSNISINLEQRPNGNNNGYREVYVVRRQVTVCLKDVSKFDAFLTSLVIAGTNRVDGITFETTALEQTKAKARQLATQAAKDKAIGIAAVLGSKIGKPMSVTESYAQHEPNLVYGARAMAMESGGGGFALGEISIGARVQVVFDLVD